MNRKRTLLAVAIVFIIIGIGGLVGQIWYHLNSATNRYGSVFSYDDKGVYYANNNIYQYDNGQSQVVIKNVSPFFELLDSNIYYVQKNKVIGYNLESKHQLFSYQLAGKSVEARVYIYDNMLMVEYGNDDIDYRFLDPVNGKERIKPENFSPEVMLVNKEKDITLLGQYQEDIEGATDFSIGNTLLYVRYPYGSSYISVYNIEKDDNGVITNMTLLEKVLPYSDQNRISWGTQNIILILVIPVTIIIIGASLLLFLKGRSRK